MYMTTGAPKRDVTAEILSSVGANSCLAKRSLNMQNTEPARKLAGTSTMGLDDFKSSLTRKGTAIPIKEIGPAKAVTQADSTLESRITNTLQALTLTPALLA